MSRRANGSYRGFLRSNAPKAAPFDWAKFRDAAPWYVKGGYSPSGNSWVCPFKGCGYGVSGLNAPVEPWDPEYGTDPIWEHLNADHPDVPGDIAAEAATQAVA